MLYSCCFLHSRQSLLPPLHIALCSLLTPDELFLSGSSGLVVVHDDVFVCRNVWCHYGVYLSIIPLDCLFSLSLYLSFCLPLFLLSSLTLCPLFRVDRFCRGDRWLWALTMSSSKSERKTLWNVMSSDEKAALTRSLHRSARTNRTKKNRTEHACKLREVS